MRTACIHVPQMSLQCATRLDPSLRGAAVALIGHGSGGSSSGVLHSPIVVACSRAAWTHGVRLGMTAASARARSSELVVVPSEPAVERETIRALADALLAVSGQVELGARVGPEPYHGAHLAMYAEVPTRTRGHAFGERVLELLEELGVTARVGIADDRFTAWVAASQHPQRDEPGERTVVTVPRGGSAAFLASRPLSLLAISPEVQHMLEALGVTTLGEFAALPAPSVARPFEADYQALARGEGGATLRPYTPDAPCREEIVVGAGDVLDAAAGALSVPAAIALIARRLALRLAGRGRTAVRLEVGLAGEDTPIELDRPLAEAGDLARVLAAVRGGARPGPWRLRVVVAGEAIEGAAEGSAPIRAAEPSLVDPLALVLAKSSADGLRNWSLVAPAHGDVRRERRDAHRRTRRGKQRRARPTPYGQARMFELLGDTGDPGSE